MENRLLSRLCEQYLAGETSLSDEQVLRNALRHIDSESISPEMQAVKAMLEVADERHAERTFVRLHTPQRVSWRIKLATAVAVVAIILIPIYKLSQPTVYGYYNGEPITSLAEAEARAQDIFNNLAQAELPQMNSLENLFELN
jgi:hypothetical protein